MNLIQLRRFDTSGSRFNNDIEEYCIVQTLLDIPEARRIILQHWERFYEGIQHNDYTKYTTESQFSDYLIETDNRFSLYDTQPYIDLLDLEDVD